MGQADPALISGQAQGIGIDQAGGGRRRGDTPTRTYSRGIKGWVSPRTSENPVRSAATTENGPKGADRVARGRKPPSSSATRTATWPSASMSCSRTACGCGEKSRRSLEWSRRSKPPQAIPKSSVTWSVSWFAIARSATPSLSRSQLGPSNPSTARASSRTWRPRTPGDAVHDPFLKSVLADRRMIEILIRDHVPEWADAIDFSTLRQEPTALVSKKTLQRRHPDMIWSAETTNAGRVMPVEWPGSRERSLPAFRSRPFPTGLMERGGDSRSATGRHHGVGAGSGPQPLARADGRAGGGAATRGRGPRGPRPRRVLGRADGHDARIEGLPGGAAAGGSEDNDRDGRTISS